MEKCAGLAGKVDLKREFETLCYDLILKALSEAVARPEESIFSCVKLLNSILDAWH